MINALVCSSLSASSIFRRAEPSFLDQVITLPKEAETLGKEDRKGWVGNFPRPLEPAHLVSEPRLEFLLLPSPEAILNTIGDRIFGPAACLAGADAVPVCSLPISPFAFLNFPGGVDSSSVLDGFAPEQPIKWVATFSGQANAPAWVIASFLKEARESGAVNGDAAAETLSSELGTLLVVLFGLGLMLIPLAVALFDKWRTERGRAKLWGLSSK